MRAMPETDIITLRPMEEFVNHIGVDELSVYKDLFVWILLLCVFHGEKGACPPSTHILQRRGMSPLLSPTERAQCFHRKIRVFPRIYQKKANIFPICTTKMQVSAGFSCRPPAFFGYPATPVLPRQVRRLTLYGCGGWRRNQKDER